ncbi:ankyrin repeat-containing domain protein [Mycena floridula]|nr:ankyrin repeat-containing domain protein [Mycena floridula]
MANIWVAASDGNTARVQELLNSGLSANVKDDNSYTPMHAAASYGHIETLELLVSNGGDINLTDDDGDTPLYVVEDVKTAQYLVEHGAIIDRTNGEGISPIQHLQEDYPSVADYLRSVLQNIPSFVQGPVAPAAPSQFIQNAASDQLTENLLASLQNIDPQADLEQQLHQAVGRTVIEGVITGYELSQNEADAGQPSSETTKKQRRDDDDLGA